MWTYYIPIEAQFIWEQGEIINIFIQPTVRTLLSGNRTLVEENRPKMALFWRFLEILTHLHI